MYHTPFHFLVNRDWEELMILYLHDKDTTKLERIFILTYLQGTILIIINMLLIVEFEKE